MEAALVGRGDARTADASVDRRAVGEQGHGLRRPAVVGQGAEVQGGDSSDDDVAVDAVAEAAGAAGAEQVVAAAADDVVAGEVAGGAGA